jgi:uncharacterized protein (TIGR03032 family)
VGLMENNLSLDELEALWARHNAEWRDMAQITSQWEEAASVDARLMAFTVQGAWWETLADAGITLLVTREYEHLVMGLSADDGQPLITYMKLPHPSGMAVDLARGRVHIASTRNPNQVYDLAPVAGELDRLDMSLERPVQFPTRPLLPVQARFLPGCFYLHDLALIGGQLHANSVGQNAVVRFDDIGRAERVWWPNCIERDGVPVFGQNHIQLNSIAAGATLEDSYFSASGDVLMELRPGHPDYPVDGRGVIFSGATREVVARGLTRPHSARLYEGKIWVDNSGYGQLGIAENGGFTVVTPLPGWTRGLGFHQDIAFVGTSRVIPRFRQYAPGLDVDKSLCGVHAINLRTGQVLGSLIWPYGNQIFAIEAVPVAFTSGFPFILGNRQEWEKKLFYTFTIE